MHNLHLVRIKSESAHAACKDAQSEIQGFGTDNNWYEICGCVSENNQVLDLQTGRFSPTGFTIEKINQMVSKWVIPDEHLKLAYEKPDSEKSTIDWLFAENYCNHMFQLTQLSKSPEEFDVLKDVVFENEYTRCGVSSFENDTDESDETYIVFVDMHS